MDNYNQLKIGIKLKTNYCVRLIKSFFFSIILLDTFIITKFIQLSRLHNESQFNERAAAGKEETL